jgi:hypothetical protein
MTALNPQVATTLTAMADATASAPYMFANPASPIVRALEKSGMIEGNTSLVDPADSKKHAYRVLPAGYAAIGREVPAAPLPPGSPDPTTGTEGGTEGGTTGGDAGETTGDDAGISTGAAGVNVQQLPAVKRGGRTGPRGPNRPVVQERSGILMALPTMAPAASRGETYDFGKLVAPSIVDPATKALGYDSFFVSVTTELPTHDALFKVLRAAIYSANKRYKAKPEGAAKLVREFKGFPTDKDGETSKAGVRVFRLS